MIGVRHPPTDSRRPARGWRGLRWPLRHKPHRRKTELSAPPAAQAHPAKLLFEKYFLWKARNGYVRLP